MSETDQPTVPQLPVSLLRNPIIGQTAVSWWRMTIKSNQQLAVLMLDRMEVPL
ncbi:MAG: hypothetical protein R3B83_03985 [Nitrospirales bacterium]|nr:hypothetical protein [Nitrospirales bacterium]